jgi:hypothetical protein
VLEADGTPEYVEMQLLSLSFVDPDGESVALTSEMIVACEPD